MKALKSLTGLTFRFRTDNSEDGFDRFERFNNFYDNTPQTDVAVSDIVKARFSHGTHETVLCQSYIFGVEIPLE